MRRRPIEAPVEREMTVEDWEAFYIAYRLLDEIAAHGYKALLTFMDACAASRPSSPGAET